MLIYSHLERFLSIDLPPEDSYLCEISPSSQVQTPTCRRCRVVFAGLSFNSLLGIVLGTLLSAGAMLAAGIIFLNYRRRKKRRASFEVLKPGGVLPEDVAHDRPTRTCDLAIGDRRCSLSVPVSGSLDVRRTPRTSYGANDHDHSEWGASVNTKRSRRISAQDEIDIQATSDLQRTTSNTFMYTRALRSELESTTDSQKALSSLLHIRDRNSRACAQVMPLPVPVGSGNTVLPTSTPFSYDRIHELSPRATDLSDSTQHVALPPFVSCAPRAIAPSKFTFAPVRKLLVPLEHLHTLPLDRQRSITAQRVQSLFQTSELEPVIITPSSHSFTHGRVKRVTIDFEPLSNTPFALPSLQLPPENKAPVLSHISWEVSKRRVSWSEEPQPQAVNSQGPPFRHHRPEGVPQLDIPLSSIMRDAAHLLSSARSISSVDFTFEETENDGQSPQAPSRYNPASPRAHHPSILNKQGSLSLSARESSFVRNLSGRTIYSPSESPRDLATRSATLSRMDSLDTVHSLHFYE